MKKIGTVFVDAGLIWIGDPCYVMGDDSTHKVKDWSEFCDKLNENNHDANNFSAPLGEGVGLAVASGLGDGAYPVYIETKDMGDWGERVSKIVIDFLPEED